MILETERLILRPWLNTDAENLYEYAKNPEVGPIAGWPAHTSIENSLEIMKDILAVPETYAVCLKSDNKAAGSIGLMIGEKSNLGIAQDEAEIGYWIGVPFWGRGLIPEAVDELMRHAFWDLNMKKLWCGYFDGNGKSKRVQEKCGFRYQFTNKDREWPLMKDIRTEHITSITIEQWRVDKGYKDKAIAPCGVICGKCKEFKNTCGGCNSIEGKPEWLSYIGKKICALYDCPVNEHQYKSCGECGKLPCQKFMDLREPSQSDEEFERSIRDRLEVLRGI